jgi:hypothetical protein
MQTTSTNVFLTCYELKMIVWVPLSLEGPYLKHNCLVLRARMLNIPIELWQVLKKKACNALRNFTRGFD